MILAIKMSVSLIQTNVLLNRNRLNCHVYFIYIKDTCLHVSERLYVFDISRGRTKTDDSPCRHAVHAVQTVKITPTTVARIVNLRVCLNFRHTCLFLRSVRLTICATVVGAVCLQPAVSRERRLSETSLSEKRREREQQDENLACKVRERRMNACSHSDSVWSHV